MYTTVDYVVEVIEVRPSLCPWRMPWVLKCSAPTALPYLVRTYVYLRTYLRASAGAGDTDVIAGADDTDDIDDIYVPVRKCLVRLLPRNVGIILDELFMY